LRHTNWDTIGREKAGSSSPIIDRFKLIMKPCREDTASSCPVLHTHRQSRTRSAVKKFTYCTSASHHSVHHKPQETAYKARIEAIKIILSYSKAGKDLASPMS